MRPSRPEAAGLVEGVVVSTAITAGDCPTGTCNDQNNHAEGLVQR